MFYATIWAWDGMGYSLVKKVSLAATDKDAARKECRHIDLGSRYDATIKISTDTDPYAADHVYRLWIDEDTPHNPNCRPGLFEAGYRMIEGVEKILEFFPEIADPNLHPEAVEAIAYYRQAVAKRHEIQSRPRPTAFLERDQVEEIETLHKGLEALLAKWPDWSIRCWSTGDCGCCYSAFYRGNFVCGV